MPSEALQIGLGILSAIMPFLLYMLKKLFELTNHTSHILAQLENLNIRVEKLEKKTAGVASVEKLSEEQAALSSRIEKMEGWMMRNGYHPD